MSSEQPTSEAQAESGAPYTAPSEPVASAYAPAAAMHHPRGVPFVRPVASPAPGEAGRALLRDACDERRPGILELAWPAVLGNLLFSTVGLVDMKIVGTLGPSAVAAVTTGNRIFFVLQAVLMAINAGTTALVARAWGAGDRDEAAQVTRTAMVVSITIAGAVSLPTLLFAAPLAGIFKLDADTVTQAASFIRWMCVFNVFFAAQMALGTALRAAGDTLTPLWIGAIMNVVNIGLLFLLVLGLYGFPRLGVAGAAIANGLSFALGAAIVCGLWWRGGLRVALGQGSWLDRLRVRQLVHIGYPAGIEQGILQFGFIAFLWIVSLYGTAPYAAWGIGVSLLSFSFVVGFGFSIAAATLVGQHLGAGDPEGATQSGWRAMSLAIGAMVLLGGTIILLAEPLARFMIDDDETVRLTVIFIWILGAVQPLMAIDFTLGGALRGAGDTRYPLMVTLTGLVVVRTSLAATFAWLGLPVEWVFSALMFDYAVKSTMLILRFRGGRWKHVRL